MVRRSWKFSKKTWVISIINLFLSTIKPFILLIIPKYIIDELAGKRRMGYLIGVATLYVSVIIFFYVADLLLTHLPRKAKKLISHSIEMDYKQNWLHMDYANFEDAATRELATKFKDHVDPEQFFDYTILSFVKLIVQLIGYSYIIVSLHFSIMALILVIVVFYYFISRRLNQLDYHFNALINKYSLKLSGIFRNMIDFDTGKEVRVNKASSWLIKKYNLESARVINVQDEKENKKYMWGVIANLIGFIQTVLIYGYCSYLVISHGISIGNFTVIIGSIMAFIGAFSDFIKFIPKITLQSHYIDDYKKFLSLSEHKGREKEIVSGKEPTNGRYDINFCNVSFKYPNTDRFVLKNINLSIKAGERLSIVGYNGAGKSTLIKLILRLYEPTNGAIYLGETDISTINLHDYRELLAVVFQDYILYWLTIRDNIVLNRGFNADKLALAIEQSGLKKRIALLEDGVETELENLFDYDRMEFSGGEGQKLACARAYYKNAPIVILDEPTSSLDALAESRLYQNFNNIIGRKTSIYISHRLASTRFCDSIAVFVDGEIVEKGTHGELMDKHGIYEEMFSKQAHNYHGNSSYDPIQ